MPQYEDTESSGSVDEVSFWNSDITLLELLIIRTEVLQVRVFQALITTMLLASVLAALRLSGSYAILEDNRSASLCTDGTIDAIDLQSQVDLQVFF